MGQILALAIALTLAGCSTIRQPLLLECPARPLIVGAVVDDEVILPYDQAVALQKWIDGTMICKDSNILMLKEALSAN